MTGTTGHGGLGESIRKGVGMIHGTGEAIRGNINAAVDEVSGDRAGVVKNKEIAAKGVDEWDRGYRGAPLGQAAPSHNPVATEHANTVGSASTNYGPHSTNTANKLDPTVDSDLDHRGAATGSTNHGPHGTNVGNKVDPRVDSDADHRGNPVSRVNPGVGYGAEPGFDGRR